MLAYDLRPISRSFKQIIILPRFLKKKYKVILVDIIIYQSISDRLCYAFFLDLSDLFILFLLIVWSVYL
jgi:hypothetical protein